MVKRIRASVDGRPRSGDALHVGASRLDASIGTKDPESLPSGEGGVGGTRELGSPGADERDSRRIRIQLYAIFVVYVATYYTIALVVGLEPEDQIMGTWSGSLALAGLLAAAQTIVLGMKTLFEMPPTWGELGSRLRARLVSPAALERVVGAFILAAGVDLMFDAFGAFKPEISQFRPYELDPWLAEIDRVVHLGQDPWLWLHAIPLRDALTAVLDQLYVRWYGVIGTVTLGVIVFGRLGARVRFLFGYVVLWSVAGTLLAILLASGGPVYFGGLAGDSERFASLLTYLDTAAPLARRLQADLWLAYVDPDVEMTFGGISAMPSLHVGVAAYFAFWARRAAWWAGLITSVWAGGILLGSVHLGWHYAIDGYLAIALAWGAYR
ncbi:MAG: phosphatase PAP2 family protein, partial [Gemmatimonadetes bacterium]|nr:phosphatase PAP2 family protein [Gemmatimonadota bacterium]